MAILTVGRGGVYSSISQAVQSSRDGDVVQVQAGTYTNDFTTVDKDITLKAVGGVVHMNATVSPPNGKAIMTVSGDVTVDGFEFSGARVPDRNGAGIRLEGGDLTLEECYFHDNQAGLLGDAGVDGTIRIRDSEFARNGAGDGYSHNVYVSGGALVVEGSYFHDALGGHELKTRTLSTTITGSRFHDNNSDASYSIDLANGGRAVLSNNVIQQGPNSPNGAIVTFGPEGNVPAGSSLAMTDNVIINDRDGSGSKLLWNATSVTAQVSGTDVWGLSSDQIASGPANISGTTYLNSRPSLDASDPVGGPDEPPAPPPAPDGDTFSGTSGSDRIVANARDNAIQGLAGDDTIRGLSGNDTMIGGSGKDDLGVVNGNDVLVFGRGFGDDTVIGFDSNPNGGQDLLDVSALGVTAGAIELTQKGSSTLVTVGEDSILLRDVSAWSIDASDFILS